MYRGGKEVVLGTGGGGVQAEKRKERRASLEMVVQECRVTSGTRSSIPGPGRDAGFFAGLRRDPSLLLSDCSSRKQKQEQPE